MLSSTRTTSTIRAFFKMGAYMMFASAIGGLISSLPALAQDGTPDSYMDPQTGHKVVHITRVPGKDSASLYFHQNSFTAAGDKMVFLHSGSEPGISIYSLDISDSASIGSGKATRLANVTGKFIGYPVLAPKSRDVYYFSGQSILATNLDSLKTRTVANLPSNWDYSVQSLQGLTLNADETLLAGSDTPGAANVYMSPATAGKPREDSVTATFSAKLPSFIFTVEVKTGKINTILKGTDWYDHVQFSPHDPSLLLFAHEGPGDKVDRMWLIRADGSGLVNFRPRQIPGEVSGHEFWGPDGSTIWFPHENGKTLSLIGRNVTTGKEISYSIPSNQKSMHYNITRDGKLFAGDGDHVTPTIWLLTPQSDGSIHSEALCSVANNDYKKHEPNVIFTPDGKWVIFTSNQSGTNQVYAVSISK